VRHDVRRTPRAMSIRRVAGALVLCGLMAVAATEGTRAGASSRTSPMRCDKTLAGLKTLSDPQRGLVDLRPRTTTIRAINLLRRPRQTPTRRDSAFQRQVWRVRAVIVRDRRQDDGDIEVILVAGHSYLIAELPAPACLPRTTRARAAIVRARRRFELGCGSAARSWTNQGAVAYVSGVGFWDLPNRHPGHAKNYAELHPVTSIRFLVGCDGEPRGGG
jgi:hypothetical protein